MSDPYRLLENARRGGGRIKYCVETAEIKELISQGFLKKSDQNCWYELTEKGHNFVTARRFS